YEINVASIQKSPLSPPPAHSPCLSEISGTTKPACGRVLFAFAITYKIGKISDLHEIYAFQSTFATLCFENAAFCFERV
ncbi:hypothetical protein ACWV3P_005904, partial [Escherichia coli]